MTAVSSRRVVVAVAAGVLFHAEGSALDRIVTTCFVVKLVAHMVDREGNSSAEVRATIASVAGIGVLNRKDKLVNLALSRDNTLYLVDLGETCFELISEYQRSSAVGGTQLKEISLYCALLCDALIAKSREN
jgi:hypothetical protein